MRTVLLGICLLALLAGIALFGFYHRFEPPSQPVIVTSQGPTLTRLERLARLVASCAQIVDVLVGETDKCRGVWLIRGDALLAIDLDRAQITEKNEETRKATIRLPQPTILQPRVDHEHSRVFEIRSLTFIPWHSDQDRVRDAVYLQAQRLVSQAAGSRENVDAAKRAAEVIIGAFFEQFGWEVKVSWADAQGTESAAVLPRPAAKQ